MNFSDLQTDFFESGFAYLNDNGVGLVRAKRWINQAYLEICALEPWSFLEVTATGTPPLAVSDFDRAISVLDNTNHVRLEHSDFGSLVQSYPDPTVVDTPLYWYLTGGTTIGVMPPATTISLSVRYVKVPTELSNASDTPLLPAAYHDIITLGAWRRGLLDDSNAGDYDVVKGEWNERLSVMRLALLDSPDTQLLTFASEDW